MGKSKKQKNYDSYISPGKWYLYKGQRILFGLSFLTFILNMSLIAAFNESLRKTALISILLSAIFAIVQFVDSRKTNWGWAYIIILCVLFHFFSALSIFSTELLFMKYIWAGELILFAVFIGLSLYKKTKR